MHLTDISRDTTTHYSLKANERRAFFLVNRGGEITFELEGSGAQAFVFAFFIGKGIQTQKLVLNQKHQAAKTTSFVLVKSILADAATLEYHGTLRIEQHAVKSHASQESRSLLLSKTASVVTKPNLEIIADDVTCQHAATVSPINREHLFYAQSRGLSKTQAKRALVHGFLDEAIERMRELGIDTTQFNIQHLYV